MKIAKIINFKGGSRPLPVTSRARTRIDRKFFFAHNDHCTEIGDSFGGTSVGQTFQQVPVKLLTTERKQF